MTPAEAGRNAAQMMLYYAIPRSLNRRAEQRVIALYNVKWGQTNLSNGDRRK